MSKIIITIIGVLLCTSFAKAQSSEAVTDSLELDRIVVTASKIPLSQRETTKPVIIIDRQEIERNSGRDLSQILNQQSGIRVNDAYGAPSNSKILYMQGATAPNTVILVDGQPINDPSGVGGLFDLRLLPLNNIERIEVIKGSQSTLYGTDAIAGVINIITQKGSEGPINGSGRLSYGAYNSLNGSLGINGSLDEAVHYTVQYNRESSDGFSAAEDPNGTGDFDADGFDMDSFYGKADVKPFEQFTISPSLNYSNYRGEYDSDAFQDAENSFTLKMFNPAVQTEYKGEKLRINGSYNYTKTERLFASEFGENEFEGRFHNADVYGNYSASEHLQFLAGFNVQDFNIPVDLNAEDEKKSQILSPYATLYLKTWNGLSTELGYRLNRHSEYGNNSTFSVAPSYNVTAHVKLFGSISSGFKSPTLDELFGPFGANPDLDPQRSVYMNVGLEAVLLDQSLKLGGQYFNREVDDLIIYSSTQGYINRDKQQDYGIELTADWIASNLLTFSGWYNFIDGEISTLDESGDPIATDNLIRRPTHSFGLSTEIALSSQFFVRVDGEYNGERTDLYFNPDNNFTQEEVSLQSYSLVNVYAEYKLLNNQLAIFGDINNLFNTDFTEVYGFNTSGLTLKAGVRFNF